MVAEGCTAGILSHHLSIPFEASNVFYGGIITYNKIQKFRALNVSHSLIEDSSDHALSEQCALEMAENLYTLNPHLENLITISTTGNLKPLPNRDSNVWYAIKMPGEDAKCYTFRSCALVGYESNADNCVLNIFKQLISIF